MTGSRRADAGPRASCPRPRRRRPRRAVAWPSADRRSRHESRRAHGRGALPRPGGTAGLAPRRPLGRRRRAPLRAFALRRGSSTALRSRKTSRIGVPSKPNALAELVLEVALVAEVDRAGVAGEEHERRRRDGDLGRVEDLRAAALDQRRRLAARIAAATSRFSSPVAIRRRRSPQMSTAASRTRPTRWPVLALIEMTGAKSRNGTSRADPFDVLVERPVGLLGRAGPTC